MLVIAVVAFMAGYAVRGRGGAQPADVTITETPAGEKAETPVVQTPATRDAAAMQNAFAEVAKVAEPAVVTITTERRVRSPLPDSGQTNPFGEEDPFEEFFRRFREFGREPNSLEPNNSERPGMSSGYHLIQAGGLGSGFIYKADGLILTNSHVVRDADRVNVKLSDGREFKGAKVVGDDERTDVAVIKINANNLPTLKLGDSTKVRVGDWAIALGNPFGLEHTLTVGVISAKAREVPLNIVSPGDYLQTDASINPGNSGGPLLDIYGRVIGVNNAIYSQSGGNIGIGFAIPINTARDIANVLVKEGRVRRAYLGVMITNVADQAAAFGLDSKTKGVLIQSVTPDTPGARAGLRPGDVVVEFNGKPVARSSELQRLVSSSPVGSTVELKILRGGRTLTVSARLEELKEKQSNRSPVPRPESDEEAGAEPIALGLRIIALTPELAQRYNIPVTKGVLIVRVEDGSPAAAADLRPGDVIESVGQTAVATPQEAQAALKRILGRQTGPEKKIALLRNRRGQRQFVIVDVTE
ncbi:MAG: Do family serine endopeptidase [Armatimonadota bacterium]|nr:Do family serine endopeptidase [Armatimonadota bacterium]